MDKLSGMLNGALLVVVVVLELIIIILTNGLQGGIETLDHVGSFLGGIAGLIAASVALLGFNVWKRQIRHGKYLALIWEAMVALHRLESHLSLSGINLFYRFQSDPDGRFTKAVADDRITTEALFKLLRESCEAVDIVAARNGVELTVICGFMKSRVFSLYRFADEPGYVNTPAGVIAWSAAISELNVPVTAEANELRIKLAKLEQKFG